MMVAERGEKIRDKGVSARGLTESEVIASRRKYGENVISGEKKRSFAGRFVSNLGDPVIKVLLCALTMNLLFMFRNSNWYETVGIAVSIFLATFISTLSEYGSEAAFDRLSEESECLSCRVRRDGTVKEIPVTEVVVGDILLLCAGDKIPADGILISGRMAVDQSAMTGESIEVEKVPDFNYAKRAEPISLDPSMPDAVLGGCVIISGEGEARVCAVGAKSFIGEISREVSRETRQSPLRLRLTKLASIISRLGYIAALLISVVFLINDFIFDSGFHPALIMQKLNDWRYVLSELLDAVTLGLTVIVVAVPEGLPMMIAVVLSSNIKRMVKDNVLVRKPVGIEAAGSMNILFTDKTGTLTEGRLSVGEYLLGDSTFFIVNKRGEGAKEHKAKTSPIMKYFAASGLYNTSSEISEGKNVVGGNMTDMALTRSVIGYHGKINARVIEKIPFDSAYKYSAVRLSGELDTVLIKGAPEKLLPYVRNCRGLDGERKEFNLVRFEKRLRELTQQGKRIVLIAEGDRIPNRKNMGTLTLIGAAVLYDKVRREAREAVGDLRGAGIHVVMVTGDNIETATEVAKESGIIGDGVDICLTSSELAKINDVRLHELLPRIGVIARALPSDKSRLVRVAQEAELVVGMTGDGINDAPALKRADIGFAMGSGTQVAKEAGDIIIIDNNLASIVKSVLYGRTIFKSIRKFIVLQLTMNMCAVGVSMLGPFVGIDAPVTVVQMLWINIIMDTLGGLAFAGEPAEKIYMKETPKRRDEPILNRYMVYEILWLGVFTIALCMTFLKHPAITGLFRYDKENLYLLTAFFAMFIFAGVFNCFNARTDSLNTFRGLKKNPAFISIMTAVAVIQIGFVYLGGNVLRTVPLTLEELKITLLLALAVFPIELVRKCFLRIFKSKNRFY